LILALPTGTNLDVTSTPVQADESGGESRIAVAIPCFNEAPALRTVIDQFRAALPGAEIVVFDNNSTDGTAEVARAMDVRVVPVPAQGKGHVVQAAFELLGDRSVLVLVDGDGTYPAEAAPLMVAPVLEGTADMVVGARQPEPGAGAMSPVRGLGNLLIRAAFRLLIGPGPGDLLSGYRAFSKHFLQTVTLRSQGFEIETELAIEAVTRKLVTLEVSVPYRPRIAGTVSKLRAFQDGRRILLKILVQGLRRDPTRVILLYAASVAAFFAPFYHWKVLVTIELALLLAGILGLSIAAVRANQQTPTTEQARGDCSC
jgi:glycosyltransferase involved in cell wall biosynthesis